MKPESAELMATAREHLSDAAQMLSMALPHQAGREAYMAAYHAAGALVFEVTGKMPKTHGGMASEFSRVTVGDPFVTDQIGAFLGQAYTMKNVSDYAMGRARHIEPAKAQAAVADAETFVERVASAIERIASS